MSGLGGLWTWKREQALNTHKAAKKFASLSQDSYEPTGLRAFERGCLIRESQDCVGARLVHKLRVHPHAWQHGQRKNDDAEKSHHYLKEPWEAVRGTDEHNLHRDP